MLDRFTGYKRLLALAALNGSGASIIERTAIGNPLTFVTDLAKPLKSLLIPFTPVQSGTGDPSPENIRSILPWNGLKVFGGGKNLFDNSQLIQTGITLVDSWYVGTRLSFYNAFGKDGKIFALPQFQENTRYTLTATGKNDDDTNGGWFLIRYTDGSSTSILKVEGTEEKTVSVTTNAGKTVKSIEFTYPGGGSVNFYVKNIQLEVGQTASTYEEYKHITDTDIVFPSPVYGGTLDVVSGLLTVEYGAVRADAFSWETSILTSKGQSFMTTGSVSVLFAPWQNENGQAFAMSNAMVKNIFAGTFEDAPANSFWWNNGRSGYRCVFDQNASVQDLMQFFTDNDVIFCGKLAEPQEIQLTPEQITALVGDNTIWSDADGSMTCVYLLTESFGDDHPISGGLGSGLLGGGLGSGTGEPDEPVDPDEPGEPDQPGDE